MRVWSVLGVLCSLLCPLPLDGSTTCQMVNPNTTNSVEGHCPVNLTVIPEAPGLYSVGVHVWLKDDDTCNSVKVDVENEILRPVFRKRNSRKKCNNQRRIGESLIKCKTGSSKPVRGIHMWELACQIVHVGAGEVVSVSYSTASTRCTAALTVPDPVPDFELAVDLASKSITVIVEPCEKVFVRWCYKSPANCDGEDSPLIAVDPAHNRTAHLVLPYLLPCICVQVYYTYIDARRREKCPFRNGNLLTDISDVWQTSKVTTYESKLSWSSYCPSRELNISASLCWMQHQQRCTPLHNSGLQQEDGPPVEFNTSAVDKHPHMCVQFSIRQSHNVHCPYEHDTPLWEAYVEPSRLGLLVHFTSSIQAKFSSQLCVLSERGCTPVGLPHSISVEGHSAEARIGVSNAFLAEKTCVEVWQSEPALQGRRVLCPDFTHSRRGMYAVVVLIFVVAAVLLSVSLYRVTTTGCAAHLYFQRPLLLVCSSDQSCHVTAVCALASLLQEQLGVTVHTSLWAQSSQTQTGTVVGVADVGPLPWLYGQWESVCRAHGKVLIVWSPDARKIYEKCWHGGANVTKEKNAKHSRIKADSRYKKTGDTGHSGGEVLTQTEAEGCVKLCDSDDCCPRRENSTLIETVFTAALACLKGALQTCKGQGVAIVYFQGLGQNQDIPKTLRCVPHYCLPQDFRGLIQELGDSDNTTGKHQWHCWPRLLAKGLSFWLAQQLTKRLQTMLHNMSSVKPEQNPQRFKFLVLTQPWKVDEEAKEDEPLQGSPW